MSVNRDGLRWRRFDRNSDRFSGYAPSAPEVEAFLDDIEAVCRKHNISLSHEDTHGGFRIQAFDEGNIEWLRQASDERP